MSEDEFWEIIEAAGAQHERERGDAERHAAILAERLEALPVVEIVSFQCWFEYMLDRAMTGLIGGAYFLISDGLGSDDGELYFRTWLVGQGEMLFRSALKDADVLADRLRDGENPLEQTESELLRYAASRACAAKTGLNYPSEGWPLDPNVIHDWVEARLAGEGGDAERGDWVPEEEIPRRLPRLAARCEVIWSKDPDRPRNWGP